MSAWVWVVVVVVASVVMRRLLARKASPDVVRDWIAAGATIVDVRAPHEFARGAYPGAINIPLHALGGRMREIPKTVPVVLYCASGMRSASAAGILRRAGYANVVNAGGLHDLNA